MSSSTSTRGGSPASIGCSVRRRCANACRVDTAAAVELVERERGARGRDGVVGARGRLSSARRMRSRSSAAAFSVKVIAAISRIGHVAVRRPARRRGRPAPWSCPSPRPPRRTASRRASSTIAARVARSSSRSRKLCWTALDGHASPTTSGAVGVVGVVVGLGQRRRSRAAPARRASASTRGSGRGCRARRDRCSCGTGASTWSAGRPGRGTRRRRCRRRWRAAPRRRARRPRA